MVLRLLQPKKAVYRFKNCKNYCDDSFSKENGEGLPIYQNLSVIKSSMYLEKINFFGWKKKKRLLKLLPCHKNKDMKVTMYPHTHSMNGRCKYQT